MLRCGNLYQVSGDASRREIGIQAFVRRARSQLLQVVPTAASHFDDLGSLLLFQGPSPTCPGRFDRAALK